MKCKSFKKNAQQHGHKGKRKPIPKCSHTFMYAPLWGRTFALSTALYRVFLEAKPCGFLFVDCFACYLTMRLAMTIKKSGGFRFSVIARRTQSDVAIQGGWGKQAKPCGFLFVDCFACYLTMRLAMTIVKEVCGLLRYVQLTIKISLYIFKSSFILLLSAEVPIGLSKALTYLFLD